MTARFENLLSRFLMLIMFGWHIVKIGELPGPADADRPLLIIVTDEKP